MSGVSGSYQAAVEMAAASADVDRARQLALVEKFLQETPGLVPVRILEQLKDAEARVTAAAAADALRRAAKQLACLEGDITPKSAAALLELWARGYEPAEDF